MIQAAQHPDDEAVDRFVANYDPSYEDRDFPRWPMRIEAPDGMTIKCLQCSGDDDD